MLNRQLHLLNQGRSHTGWQILQYRVVSRANRVSQPARCLFTARHHVRCFETIKIQCKSNNYTLQRRPPCLTIHQRNSQLLHRLPQINKRPNRRYPWLFRLRLGQWWRWQKVTCRLRFHHMRWRRILVTQTNHSCLFQHGIRIYGFIWYCTRSSRKQLFCELQIPSGRKPVTILSES